MSTSHNTHATADRARAANTKPRETEAILGPGVPTGVLNSFGAVTGTARNLLPGLKADLARLGDGAASPAERGGAAITLAFKATVIAVIAYVASLEFTQLKAGAERAKAEACSARMNAIINSVPMNKWHEANAALFKDCGPL